MPIISNIYYLQKGSAYFDPKISDGIHKDFWPKSSLSGKMYRHFYIVCYHALKALVSKNWFYFFSFSLSCNMEKFHHISGSDATYTKYLLIFFYVLCVFQSYYDKPKVWHELYYMDHLHQFFFILKINFIMLYSKNVSLISNRWHFIKIFALKEYIIIIKFFKRFIFNKPIRNKA